MNKLQQECKDEVANRYGFANWEGLTFSPPTANQSHTQSYQSLIDEAMQLYAERYARAFGEYLEGQFYLDADWREEGDALADFNKTLEK
jgi:hypothetical protein